MDRDILTLEITANAFLWKMVRAIVGTLLVCEEQGMNSRSFAKLLEKRDHKLCGPTAPPQGLFLTQVEYPVTKSF
jgi:tRNA pseudouridine38-40 synthase